MKTPQSLNVSIQTWYNLSEDYNLPIFIDIADIRDYSNIPSKMKIDTARNDYRINQTDSPFKKVYEKYKLRQDLLRCLSYIDKRPIYDGKTFIQHEYEVDTVEELLDILIESGIQADTFVMLKQQLNYYIDKVKFNFLINAKEILDYDRDFTKFALKDETPQHIAKQMIYSPLMSHFQSGMEYTDIIIFPENIGKSFMEYSWREVSFKLMYISMKNKIEGFGNKYQQHRTDEIRNKK